MPRDSLINSATGNTIIKSNVNVIGKMVINELSSTTGSGTDATLLINHATAGGTSSIVFTSATNRGAGADYAYIRYSDNRDSNTTSENSLLTIGVDNDTASPNLVHVDNMKLAPSGWLDITGNTNILSTLPSSSTTTGALTVAGGVGVFENVNVGGNIRITKDTESTTTTSGALTVKGGVGIEKNLYVGGKIVSPSITPTGSIMAYLGTTEPAGWIFGNGTVRTDNSDGKYNGLADMGIGSGGYGTTSYTPPNFNGAFLRGTGTNGIYSGPAVKSSQNHATQTHSHGVTQAAHSHGKRAVVDGGAGISDTLMTGKRGYGTGEGYIQIDNATISISIDNSTLNTDPNETRPYNFGVNWIIKL